MLPANTATATLMAYTASGARQVGVDQTVKMLVRAFPGFPVDIMDPASNLGANVTVSLAGWETCAIARSAKFRANMAHAQTTQRNASVTKIFMAKNVKGNNVCIIIVLQIRLGIQSTQEIIVGHFPIMALDQRHY